MHAAQLLLDDLGNGRRGGQLDRNTGSGIQLERLRRDIGEAEGFDAVRQEVRPGSAAVGLDLGDDLALPVPDGIERGLGLAVHHEAAGGEGLGVAEAQHAAGLNRT